MDHRSEVVEPILQNRCLLLPLFRHVFACEPDAAFVAVFAGDEATGALDLVATDENDLASLAAFLRGLPTGDGTVAFVDAARLEYTRLFIGPQKALALLWESMYLDPRELLFLASTADVKRRYEAEGFRVNAEGHEAEDSIALQLDFLAHLAQRTLDAFRSGDDAEYARLLDVQRAFEHDHMLDWLPAFAARALAAPSALLYPPLCAGVASFTATDAALLEELASA